MSRADSFKQFVMDEGVELFLAEVLEFAFGVVADGCFDVFEHVIEIWEEVHADFSCLLQSAVKIDGSEEGLEKVSQCGGFETSARGGLSFSEQKG